MASEGGVQDWQALVAAQPARALLGLSIMALTVQRLAIRTSRQRRTFLQSWRTRPIRFSISSVLTSGISPPSLPRSRGRRTPTSPP